MMICDACHKKSTELHDLPVDFQSLEVCPACDSALLGHLRLADKKGDEFRHELRKEAFKAWLEEVTPAPGPAPGSGPGSG